MPPQTASRVAAPKAGNGQIMGLRFVGNRLILDRKRAATIEVTLPGSGGATQIAPAVTTRSSLTSSTAFGSALTVDLGAASGTPAPALTGTLTRPRKAVAAALESATFVIEAADQGGVITLGVTATNAAVSATATAA